MTLLPTDLKVLPIDDYYYQAYRSVPPPAADVIIHYDNPRPYSPGEVFLIGEERVLELTISHDQSSYGLYWPVNSPPHPFTVAEFLCDLGNRLVSEWGYPKSEILYISRHLILNEKDGIISREKFLPLSPTEVLTEVEDDYSSLESLHAYFTIPNTNSDRPPGKVTLIEVWMDGPYHQKRRNYLEVGIQGGYGCFPADLSTLFINSTNRPVDFDSTTLVAHFAPRLMLD